jgi:uncharacterized protein HemY
MIKFLSILFIIIFVIPYLLRAILRFLFGRPSQESRSSRQKRDTPASSSSQKKKIISKNEGEYVDYVEIKD